MGDPYATPTDEEWAEIQERFEQAQRTWKAANDEFQDAFAAWRTASNTLGH